MRCDCEGVRPELDVWHPINGSGRAKRKESSACQLDMPNTALDRDMSSTCTLGMPPIWPPTTTTVPSNDRPPPSLVSCCRPPIDGGDGSEVKLIGRKGGNLDRAVNHRARDRVHTRTKVSLVQPGHHVVSHLSKHPHVQK